MKKKHTIQRIILVLISVLLMVFIGCETITGSDGGGDTGGSSGGSGSGGGSGGGGTPPPPPPPTYTRPTAVIKANSTIGIAPMTLSFTDQSTGDITSREWTFHTGETASGRDVSFRYTKGGKYPVKLKVSGPAGSDSKIITITMDEIWEITRQSVGPYWPMRIEGDCEFDGHGPRVTVNADLTATYPGDQRPVHQVYLNLRMYARETVWDWTTASGNWRDLVLFNLPAGFAVKEFLSATSASWTYTDTNLQYDYSPQYQLGRFIVKGDTEGNDICGQAISDTHMIFANIYFKVRITPR